MSSSSDNTCKFCYLVTDDPQRDSQNVFITKGLKEWMYSRFGDHDLFQSPIPFIFRDDGLRSRLRKYAEESIDVKRSRMHEP